MMLEARSSLGGPFGASTPINDLSRPELEVVEHSDFGCVLCSAAVDVSEIYKKMSKKGKLELPRQSGAVVRQGERTAIWLSPRSWLILCSLDDEPELIASINGAFPDHIVLASAFSDYICWLSLSGEEAEDKLRQGGFVSFAEGGLSIGHAKRTLIGGIPVVIQRKSTTAWTLGIERSYASYFINWLRSVCE